MRKEFELWYTNLKESREIDSSPSMEEIAEWIEIESDQQSHIAQIDTEYSIYKYLREKVVVLSGDCPVVHADYLEKIKTETIYCNKHKVQFVDLITKRCSRCRTATIAPLNELLK